MVGFHAHQTPADRETNRNVGPQAIGDLLPEVLRLRGIAAEQPVRVPGRVRRNASPRLLMAAEFPLSCGMSTAWPMS